MPQTMLTTAQTAIRQAAQSLGYDEQRIAALLEAEAEHIFEIELASGKKFPAYRIQHNSKLGPYKGGIRFHPHVTLDEVRALATLMSLKTAVAGLPLGGGKGGVAVDVRQLDESELEELSRRYARHLSPHLGPDKDIPAPDVNTNAKIMDWMADELRAAHGELARASMTGKSIAKGGSLGREAATGRGGVIALAGLLEHLGKAHQQQTVALQGFGNVGYYFAKIMQQEYPHLRLVAVANSKTTVYKPDGIDVLAEAGKRHEDEGRNGKPETRNQKAGKQSGRAAGYTPKLDELRDFAEAEHQDSAGILAIKADILVLAALEDAITQANMREVQAGIVVELANGPVTQAAHDYLSSAERGVIILPDIIANAGGVIVSYLEWRQNLAGEQWSEAVVNQKLTDIMQRSLGEVLRRYDQGGRTLKRAAFEVAVAKLLG